MLNLTRYATGCRLRNWMPVVQLFVQLHRWPYIAARLGNRTRGELSS